MTEFGITIIHDINTVMHSNYDDAIVHIIDDNIMVSHRYGNYNIVTWFKGDGVMHIYKADSVSVEALNNLEYALYDIHWGISGDKPEVGYRKAIEKLLA